jgi:hypothetical protein
MMINRRKEESGSYGLAWMKFFTQLIYQTCQLSQKSALEMRIHVLKLLVAISTSKTPKKQSGQPNRFLNCRPPLPTHLITKALHAKKVNSCQQLAQYSHNPMKGLTTYVPGGLLIHKPLEQNKPLKEIGK